MYSFEKMRNICKKRILMLIKQGYDIPENELLNELNNLPDSIDKFIAFGRKLKGTKYRPDYKYYEPDDLEQIKACRPQNHEDVIHMFPTSDLDNENLSADQIRDMNLSKKEIKDKIYGGVFGRIAGCILGKPLEVAWGLADIKNYLEPLGAWPLSDYVPQYSPTQKHALRRDCIDSMKGFISHAQPDDDINYLILGLHVLEDYGVDFTSRDMAKTWLENLPINWTWGPEHSRYRLFANADLFSDAIPQDDEFDELTWLFNDGEELIGAMIRGDAFGLVNPRYPAVAAEMAYRDGYMTHKKTGLYAEMWVAATISAAFGTFDPVKAIEIGAKQLPEKSRYYEAIMEALDISVSRKNWLDAYEIINKKWGHLGHAGTFNETAAIINALVHSVGENGIVDFEKAICMTVMHGWDADCSGATAGCIAGVLAGYHNIPQKWLAPLNNTFSTCVATEDDVNIDKIAERMYQMSRISTAFNV